MVINLNFQTKESCGGMDCKALPFNDGFYSFRAQKLYERNIGDVVIQAFSTFIETHNALSEIFQKKFTIST